LFQSAIERIRGTQSATTEIKRAFIENILSYLQEKGLINKWDFRGAGERHDYEVKIGNITCIIEAKGCLDGNNTNIFERPANANEFVIWSLCQNPGSNPRHNAWSGIHTRLSAEIIHRKQIVDGLIIWDMICGTKGRPCPKIKSSSLKETGQKTQPCLYLFPSTIADPRNNPIAKSHTIKQIKFFNALYKAFYCSKSDLNTVDIEARMTGNKFERRTTINTGDHGTIQSGWTEIKRAKL